MQILRTVQEMPTEVLEFEPFVALDKQGLPTYGDAIEFSANVEERDAGRGREFVIDSEGSKISTPITLYVAGDEVNVPNEKDRIPEGVVREGEAFIVAERTPVRGLRQARGENDHYRIRLRPE